MISNIDNFFLEYRKKRTFQKETPLFQIFNGISLKKGAFVKEMPFFMILEKRTSWKKMHIFFPRRYVFFPNLKKKRTFFAFSLNSFFNMCLV